jgi:hypothetical protein
LEIAPENLSSLANALLQGGDRGSAPNLEEVCFIALHLESIELLGSQLGEYH